MANSLARSCMVQGCPNLVTKTGAYRCEKHQRAYLDQWEKPRDVLYTSQMWRRFSKIFLSQRPTCERCGEPSEIAHHRIRKRDGGADDFENLEALCRSCHEREHNQQGERWKRRERSVA